MIKHVPLRWRSPCIGLAGALLLAGMGSVPAVAGVAIFGGGADHRHPSFTDRPALQLVQTQRSERAREQANIGRLEEEIRRLNGRIEELEFQQRQTNNRLDRLLEGREQGTAAGPETGRLVADNPLIDDPEVRSPEQALQDLANQTEEGTLGRIPESAVANLPRPGPDDVAPPKRGTFSAEQQYEDAVKLLQAGNYQGAQSGLELFLDVHEGHQLASNAAYWLAETHYVRQNYSAAAAAFARNYRNYGKDSPKAIDNLLKLGMSLSNLGESDKACLSYDELANTFPNTPAHIQQAVNRERARAQCG